MPNWGKCQSTFQNYFSNIEVAEMSNLEIPVPESDFNYVATLADQHSLQIVFEGKNIIRESDKTTWIYLGPYEARQMAAILLGFADSCDGGVDR
jgi:hypothetical protein